MAVNKKLVYEIIKVVATSIITIAAMLLGQACTMSMSIQKNTTESIQRTEQDAKASVDSTKININN